MSTDLYLGLPANIMSTTLFLYAVCVLTGYTPNTVTIQMTNAHIYENSYEAVNQILKAKLHDLPTLTIDPASTTLKKIESMSDVKGCFSRILPSDFVLSQYTTGPKLADVKMMA